MNGFQILELVHSLMKIEKTERPKFESGNTAHNRRLAVRSHALKDLRNE